LKYFKFENKNLSDEELAALKSLKSNDSIVICKADKGNCIVILDKESYMKKAEDILKGQQFEMLKDDKFHRKREEELNRYVFSLFKEGIIDQKLRYQLQSTCSSLSVFYGLPKVHKNDFPIRPIISTIRSYQYQLSKYLARAIREAGPQANSYIKDSFEFVKKIKDTILEKEKEYIMCSFDVESLYNRVKFRIFFFIKIETPFFRSIIAINFYTQ
jgi:sugar-specific transcriptional regulator TrmB